MSTQEYQGRALVTGASTGIGAVYADRLAKRGYDLILVARDASRLKALSEKIGRETGRHVEVLAADLATKSDRARVEERLRSDKSLTALVNNAGIGLTGALAESDPDALEAMIEVKIPLPNPSQRSVHTSDRVF